MEFVEPRAPVLEIPYEFLSDECRRIIPKILWDNLVFGMQRLYHHIISDLEGFLSFQTFPPGPTTTTWSNSEVVQFEERLQSIYQTIHKN